jgi:hypothetical protein
MIVAGMVAAFLAAAGAYCGHRGRVAVAGGDEGVVERVEAGAAESAVSVRWLIRESDAATGLELAGGAPRGTGPSRGFGWIVAEANRIDPTARSLIGDCGLERDSVITGCWRSGSGNYLTATTAATRSERAQLGIRRRM